MFVAYFHFDRETLSIRDTTYEDGQTAILIKDRDGAPYATLSTNLGPDHRLPDGQFWLKDWSENQYVAAYLLRYGYIAPVFPTRRVITGFVWTDAHFVNRIRITPERARDLRNQHIRETEKHDETGLYCALCEYYDQIEDLPES